MSASYQGGYVGRLLFVELDTGSLAIEPLSPDMARRFVGGYGLGAKVLWDRQRPGADPLGPENTLGFVTGPLTGSLTPFSGRYVVVGKSPLTGTWGDANSGGFFGPQLKFAGFDAVFFTGVAPRPTYLYVEDGRAELRDAGPLWGLDTAETEAWLKAAHGSKVRSTCIGPAGEKQALISCVINDRGRAAARSGLGAVMGSKRLKAVAVQGSGKVPLAQPERVKALRKECLAGLTDYAGLLKAYGTPGEALDLYLIGRAPVKNWSGSTPEDFPDPQALGGDAVIAFERRKFTCWGCPVGCGGFVTVDQGPFAVAEGHKPEYETLAAFGTNCLNADPASICKLNDLCNRYGLDTISAGSAVAFAMECFERGLITTADTGGLSLGWGDAVAMVQLTEQMGRREGFGALLAHGVQAAARRIGQGAEEFAVHFGGQEPGMHDPRHTPRLALNYALEATPGRHTQGGTDATGSLDHLKQSAGLCGNMAPCVGKEMAVDFLNAVVGWDLDMEACMRTGERIGTMRHAFNLREGINPLRFPAPARALGIPPLERGMLRGNMVDLPALIREYLASLDWDPVTAIPSAARLVQLELPEVAEVLHRGA
jgi:aldehyde:ferredoxin oxidoreductase